jgi:hypothetical protein
MMDFKTEKKKKAPGSGNIFSDFYGDTTNISGDLFWSYTDPTPSEYVRLIAVNMKNDGSGLRNS